MKLSRELDTSLKSILAFPHEHILLTLKKHKITIIPQIILAAILGICVMAILSIVGYILFKSYPLLTLGVDIILAVLILNMITKIIIDWYFHFYIVTTQRIIELYYTPLFSCRMNDVLLSQVACTEISIKSGGILNEVLDIGDVRLTFDRPTLEQDFVFYSIKNPREIGTYLSSAINKVNQNTFPMPVWYRSPNYPNFSNLGKSTNGVVWRPS